METFTPVSKVDYNPQVLAVCVFVVEFMFPVKLSVTVKCFVVISVKNHVPRTVHLVLNHAKINVFIANAQRNVVSLVFLVWNHVLGDVSTINAQNVVVSHVTDQGAITPARKNYVVDTNALECVANVVRGNAEFVIKKKCKRFYLGMKTNPMHVLWNLNHVVT